MQFSDTDTAEFEVGGTVSWDPPASDAASVQSYNVWLAHDKTQDLVSSHVALESLSVKSRAYVGKFEVTRSWKENLALIEFLATKVPFNPALDGNSFVLAGLSKPYVGERGVHGSNCCSNSEPHFDSTALCGASCMLLHLGMLQPSQPRLNNVLSHIIADGVERTLLATTFRHLSIRSLYKLTPLALRPSRVHVLFRGRMERCSVAEVPCSSDTMLSG